VVANLPYIPTAAWDRLPPEVQREPRLALDGGGDGLDLYRRLLPQAAAWLAPGGLLACEIGLAQADVLIGMLQQGGWQQVRLIRDYRGEERVVTAHTAEHGVCGRLHDDQLSDG
jgi:release factor glutamine methyltransferase